MEKKEVVLMKGNEAIAHAAIRCGCDGYFGYPITPQSEVIETLAELKPWETTGMVVLQAESEVASINMIYGGAGAGKRVMTSSSSPGVALMQEGIAYMAGAELPGVFVNVQRGGPGLGTIQPSQSDYFQATRGGGNGDYGWSDKKDNNKYNVTLKDQKEWDKDANEGQGAYGICRCRCGLRP